MITRRGRLCGVTCVTLVAVGVAVGRSSWAAPPGSADQTKPNEKRATRSMADRVKDYAVVRLTADLSRLTPKQRRIIPLFIEAAQQMDEAFSIQAYGDTNALLARVSDPALRRFVEINYGPWDRLRGNAPFVAGVGPKPPGANFYPPDMTKEAFAKWVEHDAFRMQVFQSPYTMVRRDPAGALRAIAYNEFFASFLRVAAGKLHEAAMLAEDPGLRRYLQYRGQALLSNNYQPSDLAWLDMKNNTLDIVIGPIETYEDQLFGYKASYEAYVLIKDKQWSGRLAKYAAMLPDLQRTLPVDDAYKRETPGTDSDLNAYDVVYYAGDCNAGSKTIAINLPNDEEVQLRKGTRRLQLKNAMRAKYEKILVPIANLLITEDQRPHITFDAFFANTMFHEVAHGLGIKNTISGKGTVREALKEQAAAIEEGKADILGLYLITELFQRKVLAEGTLMDYYATFLASIFRSVRFGASSAHGRANMLRFHFFQDHGAFTRDKRSGTYRVEFAKMQAAMRTLATRILKLQGNGDYEEAKSWTQQQGQIDPLLQADLDRLAQAGIPVDIVFEQGMSVLR